MKSTANLEDTETTEFSVQVIQGPRNEWGGVYHMTFTTTIKPWSKDRVNGSNGLDYTDATVAEEVAKAIKAKYPDYRIRVIMRNTIVEETFIKEI